MKKTSSENHIAIVTGAGTIGDTVGNGRAIALLLAQKGYSVLAADISYDLAKSTEEMIRAEGGTAWAFGGDVSDATDVENMVNAALELPGNLTALVNNVGIAEPPGNAVDVDLEGWNRALAINVTSMLLTSRFSIPHMIENGHGSIVNISSVAGMLSHDRIAYATTKGAVISLTKSIAIRYGMQGIRANTVAPGLVRTPLVENLAVSEAALESRKNASALKTEGSPWDIAESVAYLVSPASKWVTGITLPVDAGLTADLRLDIGY